MSLGNTAPAAVLLHRKPTFAGNLQSVSSAIQLTLFYRSLEVVTSCVYADLARSENIGHMTQLIFKY